jgi:hypothetical protein
MFFGILGDTIYIQNLRIIIKKNMGHRKLPQTRNSYGKCYRFLITSSIHGSGEKKILLFLKDFGEILTLK